MILLSSLPAMQPNFILLQCQLPNSESSVLQRYPVLLSRHQLCVKQDYQFVGSSSDSRLSRQVQTAEVATSLAA